MESTEVVSIVAAATTTNSGSDIAASATADTIIALVRARCAYVLRRTVPTVRS